jgi:restriction endonuclease NotI
MAGKKTKIRARYSIGEWYGGAFEYLSAKQRNDLAKLEVGNTTVTGLNCPFQKGRICNKKGGVCSLRKYEQTDDQPTKLVGPLITTCPNRFLEDSTVFRWIGEEILQTKEPVVLGQIGFLDRLRPAEETTEEDSRDFVGRIDNVLVHPTKQPIDWCAVELQAVYFSGKSMNQEFRMLAAQEYADTPFPAAHRRPDWRSSGPKRLLPQLQTKVPTIRTWGKKMAVVIDEAFFSSLIGLEPERYLSNAEIVWFVITYELKSNRWKLTPKKVIFSQLDTSVKALTGGVPLSKEKFEAQLQEKLRSKARR